MASVFDILLQDLIYNYETNYNNWFKVTEQHDLDLHDYVYINQSVSNGSNITKQHRNAAVTDVKFRSVRLAKYQSRSRSGLVIVSIHKL